MKILIAYDGSDCANRAIDDLRRAGLPPEAEAVVISVADVLLPVPPPSSYELVEAVYSSNVGSHGRTAMGRFFLGSVSQKIVTNAPCTVRIARNSVVQNNSPVRIVVGIDGSPGAEAAVRAVCERVWPPGSQIRLVAALDPMMITVVEWIKDDDKDESVWVGRMAEASAEKLRAAELVVCSVITKVIRSACS